MQVKLFIAILFLLFGLNLISATDFLSRPDGHAPIGIMGDHVHHKGEWMISTRVMHMGMSGIQQGTEKLSKSKYFSHTNYMKYPKTMDMWMAMLGLMYAPSDIYTLMFMANYQTTDMSVQGNTMSGMSGMAMQGASTSMDNAALSDISLSSLFALKQSKTDTLVGQIGFSIPVAEPDAKSGSMTLAYPMQLTGGTYDAKLGLTYTQNKDSYSWGSQLAANLPLGNNDFGYRLGSETKLNTWIAKPVNTWLSFSGSLSYITKAKIEGRHDNIMLGSNPMNPLIQADNSGHRRLALGIGFNFLFNKVGRIALESSLPLYQDYSGYQMPSNVHTTLGWQKAF